MKFAHSKLLAAAVLLAASAPMCALALESTAQISPRATVTLVSDKASVRPGDTVRIALRQKLAPHWHTYWKNSGDAGAPPTINLKLPDGASAGEIQWPGPDRISTPPAMSFGYEAAALFPIEVKVPASAAPGTNLPVKAEATWLVCKQECIPESGSFQLDLPVGAASAPASADVLAAFAAGDARTPATRTWPATLTDEGAALALTIATDALNANTIKDAFFYPDAWGVVVHASPQRVSFADGKLNLAMEKGQTFNAAATVSGLLSITDTANRTQWFAMAPQITAGSTEGTALSGIPLWQAALFAFLGGLLLNLMPCVFPVLAIKAVSVAGLSGGKLREVRLSGAFYTAGVLAAFIALAALLLALRASGAAVGWGFQFQSPVFVAVMAWLLLAIGLNLSGVYEIGLGLTGAGHKLTRREGHAGSFFTGLLAVIVATPCTAPFMGVAIGAALAAPAWVCLALFAAMGLGLAAPYALLVLFPRLARRLPRPGRWMIRLRQGMAFPMYASAAWLVWVLAQQSGNIGVAIALGGALLVAIAAWLFGMAQHDGGRGLVTRGLSAAAVLALAVLLHQLGGTVPSNAATQAADSDSERFTAARLTELRKEGKPVFVNMTAAWCITCLVNERTTLSTKAVQDALRGGGVTYLKGDWTNRDPEITNFLRGFNRDGLPFYAYYPANGRDPVVLPPVLTESIVLNEIRKTTN